MPPKRKRSESTPKEQQKKKTKQQLKEEEEEKVKEQTTPESPPYSPTYQPTSPSYSPASPDDDEEEEEEDVVKEEEDHDSDSSPPSSFKGEEDSSEDEAKEEAIYFDNLINEGKWEYELYGRFDTFVDDTQNIEAVKFLTRVVETCGPPPEEYLWKILNLLSETYADYDFIFEVMDILVKARFKERAEEIA
jgi:hypothetical protein